MKEIYQRRSVRKFKEQEVENEKVLEIIKAGMNAPRARGLRVGSFIIINDKDLISKINEYKPNYLSPILIAIVAEPEISDYWQQDLGACMENMMLTATNLGLGTCWLGVTYNETAKNFLNEVLEIPENKTVFALLSVGYVDGNIEENNYFDENVIYYNIYKKAN